MLTCTADQLRAVGRRIFSAAGAPEDVAAHVADSLVLSNLSGHDSHGVIRIPAYVQGIQRGSLVPAARPSVLRETPTTAVLDGNLAFGQIAATVATDLAIAKAKEAHLAGIGIIRCNHIGRLGEYAERATKAGMIGIVVGGSFGVGGAAPFGGAARALGTNPFSFGVPAGTAAPMIVDFATTVVAEGKLQVARAKKEPVPPGWIVDKEGRPTTDVEDYYAGGAILPFGGHKGYGLSMVAAVLGGILPAIGSTQLERGGGTFLLVLDPDAFRPFAEFAAATDGLFGMVKQVPTAPGFAEILVPGEPEQRSRAKRLAEGIPVPEETWRRLEATASELGVGPLE
jgi:LDH2 family malate/lactate/ureidoglycolate dehydrogenase